MRWFDVGRQGILVQIFPKYACTSLPICSRSQLISHRYLFFYGPDPNAPQNQMISLSTSEFHCVFKKNGVQKYTMHWQKRLYRSFYIILLS